MRHGYPTAMGAPITILKRGPSGTSQIDTQVKYLPLLFNTFISVKSFCIYEFYFKVHTNLI